LIGAGTIVVPIGMPPSDLAGLDPETGTIVWRTDGTFYAPAAATDDIVVINDLTALPPPGGGPVTTGPDGKPPPLMEGNGYSGIDRATGAKRWSAMVYAPQQPEGSAPFAAVEGAVVVLPPGPNGVDAATGATLWTSPERIGGGATGDSGVIVFAGQDDDVTVLDAATGVQAWTAPGKVAYDDVIAVGSGAVYVVDGDHLVAYELESGSVRWSQPQDPQQLTQPWLVDGTTLFTMWWNLEARSTDDGTIAWHTDYPTKEEYVAGPRMISAASNGEMVAVGFASGSLGGD
jgi:outer membrane protein assembly factor BamB